MWRSVAGSRNSAGSTFDLSAFHADIGEIRESLGVSSPDDLTALLLEMNGVTGEYGLGVVCPPTVSHEKTCRCEPLSARG